MIIGVYSHAQLVAVTFNGQQISTSIFFLRTPAAIHNVTPKGVYMMGPVTIYPLLQGHWEGLCQLLLVLAGSLNLLAQSQDSGKPSLFSSSLASSLAFCSML